MKLIAMIPARLGSKRVQNKNLRLINGKPLIAYIVETAVKSNVFDDIYINSEAEIFREIAEEYGVKFYQRPEALSSDTATNDEFTLDFMNAVESDAVIQLLATSPFVSADQIQSFTNTFIESGVKTLISVVNHQIECVYKKEAINFVQKEKTPPSQQLTPVQSYACSLMAWETQAFKENIKTFSAAYHGGDKTTEYFPLEGYATIDVDNESDFQLAEVVAKQLASIPMPKAYYQSKKVELVADADRERILNEDGVKNNTMLDYNKEWITIEDIIQKNGRDKSWSHTVINSPSNSATLIGQLPGEGNRLHFHPDWDEWWYIVEGQWNWEIEGQIKEVKAGDVVFIQRNRWHKITATGDKMAIRLAVSRNDVDHIYNKADYVPREEVLSHG